MQDPDAQLEQLRRNSLLGPGDLKLPTDRKKPSQRQMPTSASIPEETEPAAGMSGGATPHGLNDPQQPPFDSISATSTTFSMDAAQKNAAKAAPTFSEPRFDGARGEQGRTAEDVLSPTERRQAAEETLSPTQTLDRSAPAGLDGAHERSTERNTARAAPTRSGTIPHTGDSKSITIQSFSEKRMEESVQAMMQGSTTAKLQEGAQWRDDQRWDDREAGMAQGQMERSFEREDVGDVIPPEERLEGMANSKWEQRPDGHGAHEFQNVTRGDGGSS
ncbi:hypothetical protein BAUCODRAFT_173854 [Baudoinia panamericana UAMH 10762]|uniref:Uncharacterized protein n=1 Tax=Baudoinia panamericana (strain UAMH 10762) TaxID=717646 RepID=M2M0N9_BAUPA|nr:uncharacterized protein BAUCODRAFT_173854 [Baudoinia panamericana UAMH 10762]EMD00568.1 hypothetical protein BAUCODRAFT_173854 [Baudoinia panamericana UAMH 10762]